MCKRMKTPRHLHALAQAERYTLHKGMNGKKKKNEQTLKIDLQIFYKSTSA